jgi:hypothetical protein
VAVLASLLQSRRDEEGDQTVRLPCEESFSIIHESLYCPMAQSEESCHEMRGGGNLMAAPTILGLAGAVLSSVPSGDAWPERDGT